jgi:hypothetical protein
VCYRENLNFIVKETGFRAKEELVQAEWGTCARFVDNIEETSPGNCLKEHTYTHIQMAVYS